LTALRGRTIGSPGPLIELFPPGPLESVEIVPAEVRIERGHERRIRAIPRDREQRIIREDISFSWSASAPLAVIEGGGPRPTLRAGAERGELEVRVIAATGPLAREASARVEIVDRVESKEHAGIPDPELVDDWSGSWRSRFAGARNERWQINSAHKDYREATGRARLRYVASLFAKELVLHTHSAGDPLQERLLEEQIGLIAFAERNMAK
jgi:hypothetical protein